jgi:hypothetical protein
VDSFDSLREEVERSKHVFGRMLKRWRLSNGWAQDTCQQWGAAADCPHVYSSQWSHLETGKGENPGPLIFRSLGFINQRLALKDFGPIPRGNLTAEQHQRVQKRVKAAKPLCHPDGRPWLSGDFFAAYVGELEWPELPDPEAPPKLSKEQAKEITEGYRATFQRLVKRSGMEPLAAAVQLLEHVDPHMFVRQEFQGVLLGFRDYSPETLKDLWDGTMHKPHKWLSDWEARLKAQ